MKKNKKLIYLIIAISFIAISAIGATYAYFLASGYSNKTSSVSVTADALDEVSCTAADLSMTVTGSDMKQGSSSADGTVAKTNSSTITCSATKHTTGTTECTMDIKYTPTNVFTKSSNNSPLKKELTLSGSGTTTNGIINTPAYYETDMAKLTSKTTIIEGLKWIFDSNDTLTYTMTTKFYNYNFNQNDLAGKTYNGTISVENISCTGVSPTYETVTLNANGGSVSTSTKQVINGYTYGTLPNATKSGSTFKGWSILPAEYQQVDYIKSAGSQYINTTFKPNQDTTLELMFNTTNLPSAAFIAGARKAYNDLSYATLIWSGQTVWSEYNNSGNVQSSYVYTYGTDTTIKYDKNKLYVDRTLVTTHTYTSFQTTVNMFLFGLNNNGYFDSAQYYIGKIYYASIKDNGNLVRYFVPCYRKSDNVIGMYDIIGNTFYTNSGSGSFTKGNNVYTTKDSLVNKLGAHTLYAIYE